MSRPPDWAPLADSDPLAGSPEEIEQQAALLRTMAAEMTWQVRTLKSMGTDANLAGDSIVALRVSATDVAAKLEKVIHRYTEAARCLSGWAPELEEFQKQSAVLLDAAKKAEDAVRRDIHTGVLDPVQVAYRQLSANASATPELAAFTRQLQAIVEEAEARGRFWAHQISEAIDDGLTDHGMAHLHGWIKNHKEQIEHYTKALGYVATIAAVGALFVPGLNVAVLGMGAFGTLGALDAVAFGSGAALLATHSVMAAEGEGSLWEVGIDIAAMATFSGGRILGRSIGRAAETTKEIGAEATGQEAAERFIMKTREEAVEALANGTDGEKIRGGKSLVNLNRDALQVADNAADAAREAPEAEANVFGRLLAGDKEGADALENANRIAAEHPGNQAVEDAADKVRHLATAGRTNWAFAAGVDGTDKVLNQYWAGSYRDFKEKAVFTHGIGWLQ